MRKTVWQLSLWILTAAFIVSLSATAPADNEYFYGGQAPKQGGFFDNFCSWIMKHLASAADPVHLKGGEYYYSVDDLHLKARAANVIITRSYSSRSQYNSRFGFGWDMNYNIKIRRMRDPNIIILLTGGNRKLEYTIDPNSQPAEPTYRKAGLYNSITENQDGTYTLIEKHGGEFDFDINGNLSAITDRNGNSLSFTYDANGLLPLYGPSEFFIEPQFGGPSDGRGLVAVSYKLTTVTDDLNRQTNLSYDANGLLTQIEDFTGRQWSYVYDCNNDLRSVTGPNAPGHPNGLTTSYAYDSSHNLLTITDPNGNTYLQNSYDANDRVYEQTYGYGTHYFSYDDDSNSVIVTDRRGFDTTCVYNTAGNPLSYTIDTNGLREDEPDSYTTSYEYNSNMEVVRKILPGAGCVDFTYDANGNCLSVCQKPDVNTNEPNVTVSYTYEPVFNLVKSVTNPLGRVTTYTYDYEDANDGNEAGNLIRITYPEIPTADGNQIPTAAFTYNQFGQVETNTSVDGIVSRFVYYQDANDANNHSRLWKIIVDYNQTNPEALNITNEYEYDALGRPARLTDPNGDVTRLEYDRIGRMTRVTAPNPYSYIMNFEYNPNSKISRTSRPIGDANQVVEFSYDALDQIKTITNPLGYITTDSYDASENLSDVNDAEANKSLFDYDARDLLWKTTDANSGITEYNYTPDGDVNDIVDANGNVTRYQYDSFNRLICITYPDDTNELFSYDAASNLLGFTNRKGESVNFQYDALGRMTVKSRPGRPDIVYTYDIAGRVVDVNDGGEITSYSYDRIGRVVDVNDRDDRSIRYSYDARGLRTQLIYPDDSNVTYQYDSLSRLTGIKYDGAPVAAYSYDELSRRTAVVLGNDANAAYEYDLANRLTKLSNNFDSAAIVFDYNDYDKVGNRLSCRINDANEQSYSYDCLYQIIDVNYGDGNTTDYSYDSLGNRAEVNETAGSTAYNHNSLNQYTSVGGTNYSYDDNGNLTNDGTYLYYYDCENRLTDVNDVNDEPIASYQYDFSGRRIFKTDYTQNPVRSTRYVYDGDHVIAEYDDQGALLRKFIYGPGIDEPVCIITVNGQPEQQYYYHYDGLGSVIALSNTDAEVIERYSYNVFGKTTIRDAQNSLLTASAFDNSYFFTGRRLDDETGLYYYRARFYAPDIGRFLQTDPIGYYDSLNLYSYCGNNPLIWTDPYGLCKGGYHWWTALDGFGTDLLYALDDGVFLTTRGVTFGLCGNDQYAEYLHQKYGGFATASEWCGNTATVALTAAVLVEKLGLDIVLWGGAELTAANAGGIDPVRIGQAGEQAARIIKNTEHIPSLTKTANYRVPDVLSRANKVIGEVKNVEYQALTNQLKDYAAHAEQQGYRFELITKKSTTLSQPLQNLVDAGTVVVKRSL